LNQQDAWLEVPLTNDVGPVLAAVEGVLARGPHGAIVATHADLAREQIAHPGGHGGPTRVDRLARERPELHDLAEPGRLDRERGHRAAPYDRLEDRTVVLEREI
jgi:hypothetical protein